MQVAIESVFSQMVLLLMSQVKMGVIEKGFKWQKKKKNWKQSKYSSIWDWLNKLKYLQRTETEQSS